MSLSLFVYILHFIHISLLGFASQLRLQCQGAALALELSKGRARCKHRNLSLFHDFSCVPRHFSGSRAGQCSGCLGHCWALVSRSCAAEEDPAASQEQLEMTVKAGTAKCDKLMD